MKVANKLFHRASAFTLVELLIYVAIFAVTSGTLTAI
ncbi:MAG: prepilin-type N-terminal cleavage/methylation domain-containing protein, partial [Candidatus Colwellbacteria bacterium]|nr:prepilin-type N-terminal cleavage/methylation domain-containing protein [Candidatus Colwellbacteria bacterium]